MKKLLALTVACVFGAVSYANAAAITGVTIASVSSEIPGFDRGTAHTIDGSGTDFSTGTLSNDPNGTMWLNSGDGAFGGPNDTNPFITYNLGAVYDLSGINIWNYNEVDNTARGIASADVYTSTDGITFTFYTSIDLLQATGDTTTDQTQSFSLDTTAQYVELTSLGHFSGDDSNFVGLSEVQFLGEAATVSPVSEPASFAVFGIGLVGLLVARKRYFA